MHRTTASEVHGLDYEPCLLCVHFYVRVVCMLIPPCVIPLINTSIHSFLLFSCCSNISLTVTQLFQLLLHVPVHVSSPRAGPSDSPANPELRDLQPLINNWGIDFQYVATILRSPINYMHNQVDTRLCVSLCFKN